jgi:hypothetical protein
VIDAAKSDQALHALHHFLIHARSMAYEGCDGACIAGVLDWAELLPRLIAAGEDKTGEFRDALEAIAESQPRLRDAVAIFDRPDPARW